MSKNTCGDCRWFDSSVCLCCHSIDHFGEAYSDTDACEYFDEVNYSAESEEEDGVNEDG